MENSQLSKFKPKPTLEEAVAEETRDQAWLCRGPCLMVSHGMEPNALITLYDVSQQTHRTKVCLEFLNKGIYGSQGEWILAMDFNNQSDCCILNAVTMEKFHIPAPKKLCRSSNFLLLGSPTAANCTVFVQISETIFYCKIGAEEFNTKEVEVEAITIFQGMMYYIDRTYTLFRAQLQDPSSSLHFEECIDGYELEDLLLFSDITSKYLFESCGRLLFVHQLTHEIGLKEFQVFRADLSGKVWEKIKYIGSDHAIFVDELKGFSANIVPSGGWLKGNCIYYTSRQGLDDENPNNITFFRYDLEDGFNTTLPSFPFKICMPEKYYPDQIWINCS